MPMSDLRAINFPIGVPYGTTYFEHGRTFEYVEPGMWKSIGGSGGGSGGGIEEAPTDGLVYGRKDGGWVEISSGGSGGSVEWADVLNKPQEIKDLSGETPAKVSLVSGGSY